MIKKLELEYTIKSTERGVVCVKVFSNKKVFFEIECFENSPYSIEEEIQNWLDDNGYSDDDYNFFKIES